MEQQAQVVDRAQRTGVPTARRGAARRQSLFDQRFRALKVALVVEQRPEVIDPEQRIGVPIAQRGATPLQRLFDQRLRALQVTLGLVP